VYFAGFGFGLCGVFFVIVVLVVFRFIVKFVVGFVVVLLYCFGFIVFVLV
jgi:hypothetical protein